jgi:DNA-damage-inducible protein D
VIEKDLKGEQPITDEHVENNQAVRKMLIERGVQPEALPPAEDVKKLQRRLDTEEKKMVKQIKAPREKQKK